MPLKILVTLSIITLNLIFLNSALAASKSTRLEKENRYATELFLTSASKVKNLKDFVREFGSDLKPADKKFLASTANGTDWTTPKQSGEFILVNDQLKFRFININLNKVEINGVEFTLDPTAPLKIQAEQIEAKLKSANKSAFYDLFFPRAEAWANLAFRGAVAVTGAAVRTVIVRATSARIVSMAIANPIVRSGAAKIGGTAMTTAVAGGTSYFVVNSLNNATGANAPLKAISCGIETGSMCQDEGGLVLPSSILTDESTPGTVVYRMGACPTVANPSYEYTVTAMGRTTIFKVTTVVKDDQLQIKEIVRSDQARPDIAPTKFTYENNKMSSVRWVGPTFSGSTEMKDYRLDAAYIDTLAADPKVEIEEEQWQEFLYADQLTKARLGIECSDGARRALAPELPAAQQPTQSSPTTHN